MTSQSYTVAPSAVQPSVEYVIAKMTFGRRIELMRRVRELAVRLEYFDAGREEKNRIEASLLGAQIDRLYVEWGLENVLGLHIDGEPATVQTLIDRGPEELFREALELVKSECGLNEAERKN
ncbi:MAG: hypothetical protein KGN84_10670 [Acidobacteriota bacterium]|nr:hypothetical protein [Acidobacteriota bacterium]